MHIKIDIAGSNYLLHPSVLSAGKLLITMWMIYDIYNSYIRPERLLEEKVLIYVYWYVYHIQIFNPKLVCYSHIRVHPDEHFCAIPT